MLIIRNTILIAAAILLANISTAQEVDPADFDIKKVEKNWTWVKFCLEAVLKDEELTKFMYNADKQNCVRANENMAWVAQSIWPEDAEHLEGMAMMGWIASYEPLPDGTKLHWNEFDEWQLGMKMEKLDQCREVCTGLGKKRPR